MRENTAIYTAFDEHVQLDSAEPERNLMRAILFSALDDIKRSGEVEREARRYLLDDNDTYIYSFRSICNHLNLCHLTVRYVAGLTVSREVTRVDHRLAA